MKRLIALLSVVIALPGCITIDGVGRMMLPAVTVGEQFSGDDAGNGLSSGEVVRIGGVPMTAISRNDARRMGFHSGRIRGARDIQSADALISRYRTLAWESFAAGDYASFEVYRHLGRHVAAERLKHLIGAQALLASVRDGAARLPGGATVFLPEQLYDQRHAALSVPFAELDWASGVKVAQAGGGHFSSLVPSDRVDEMPVGTVFIVGNDSARYLVERSNDGFMFHNPGRDPVRIELEQLGYMPIVSRPASWRRSAVPIAANVKSALRALARESYAAGDKYSPVRAAAPSYVVSGRLRWPLDGAGGIANGPRARAQGESAYRTNRAYRFAIDLYSVGTGRIAKGDFESQCRRYGHERRADVFVDSEFRGPNLERMRVTCSIAPSMAPVFSREFLVLDDMSAKSFDSVMHDQRIARRIDEINSGERLAEALTAFVPFLSNVDAGARCLNQTTATAAMYRMVRTAPERDLDVFVRELLFKDEDPSALERGLDCTLGLAVPGALGRSAGRLAGGYRTFKHGEQAEDVAAALRLFDQHTFSVAGWGDVATTLSKTTNQKTLLAAKLFYEGMQTTQDFTELSAAVAQQRSVGG